MSILLFTMSARGGLLENLIKHFYSGTYYNIVLQPEDVASMTWDWQESFLDATINSDLIQKYPISNQSMRLFIKKITESLEGKQEIHDDFYRHLCNTMKNTVDDSSCYRHYLIKLCEEDNIITIKETNKMVVNGTTGMRTWEAGIMLADWALSHRSNFTNKTVLELGSGVGLTGITIGKFCKPKCIYLTDCHPEVMKTICENIQINYPQSVRKETEETTLFTSPEITIGAMPLDWNNIEDIPMDTVPDVVIGADIVYDPVILEPLCQVLKCFYERNKNLKIFIASIIRNEETFKAFLQSLNDMNFVYEKMSLEKNTYLEWDPAIERCLLQIKCLQ